MDDLEKRSEAESHGRKKFLSSKSGCGSLLFAFNNEQVNYVELATNCAKRVKTHLKLNSSLVTDKKSAKQIVPGVFDQVIIIDEIPEQQRNKKFYYDYGANLSFLNRNRCTALEHTPYEKTVLIDVDLLISSDAILKVWNGKDFALTRDAYSVSGDRNLPRDTIYLSDQNQLRMYWATIICFDSASEFTRRFFDAWKKAVEHYETYSSIFKFAKTPMRNDFAVTVSMERTLGLSSCSQFLLRYKIPTLLNECSVTEINEDGTFLVCDENGKKTRIFSDLHVMNKKSIIQCLHSQKAS